MKAPPVISVVMPVYNGARWLAESLGSIRRQNMTGIETVVVDDGSTDESAAVVRREAPAAIYICQENRGASAARNRGIAAATAGLIAFLDQDDVWPEESLKLRWEALEADPAALFVLGRTRLMGGSEEQEPWVSPNLGAGLYRRELFARVGAFNEATRLLDDTEWFFRIREARLPYVTLAGVTLDYRQGTDGITSGGSWRDPELLATLRASLARRRAGGRNAEELQLLSGAQHDPRAAGPVNHEPDRRRKD